MLLRKGKPTYHGEGYAEYSWSRELLQFILKVELGQSKTWRTHTTRCLVKCG